MEEAKIESTQVFDIIFSPLSDAGGSREKQLLGNDKNVHLTSLQWGHT